MAFNVAKSGLKLIYQVQKRNEAISSRTTSIGSYSRERRVSDHLWFENDLDFEHWTWCCFAIAVDRFGQLSERRLEIVSNCSFEPFV